MNPSLPSKRLLLLALATFWAFYGLLGRDAWKGEEALAFGHVLDWLELDQLHTSPVPLHTLLAGLFAQLVSPWLDLQDGARLFGGLATLLALAFAGLAARALYDANAALAAVLLLMGAFGLMLRTHALLPDSLQLAAWALLLYGAASARQRPEIGAPGIALALLALTLLRGLPDLIFGLLILLLPLFIRDWRTPAYRRALTLGLSLAVLLISAWLAWLAAHDGLGAWLARHGLAGLAPTYSPARLVGLLAWAAWPLWPLAAFTLWHQHRRLSQASALHLPLIALAVLTYAALTPGFTRDGSAVPLLLPLALLGAHAITHMPRGAAQAFYWFGVLTFGFFALAFWLYFAALDLGWPPQLAGHMARLTPGYSAGSVAAGSLALAILATLLWLVAIPLFPRAKLRPALVWATGMVLCWVLLISLFRPWAEAGWAWRPMLAELDRQLPPGACLQADVDAATRIMLRHHLSARLAHDGQVCDWRLIQGGHSEFEIPDADASIVWIGQRPREKQQILRLYRHGAD